MNTVSHISVKCLLSISGPALRENTVKAQLYRHRGRGQYWQTIKDNGIIHIVYSSIPDDFKEKYGLPTDQDGFERLLASARKVAAGEELAEKAGSEEADRVQGGMALAVQTGQVLYVREIKRRWPELKAEKLREYARRAAALAWIKDNYQKGRRNELAVYHACYSRLQPAHINPEKPSSYNSFANLLGRLMRPDSDVAALAVNKKSIIKVQPRTPDYMRAILQSLYASGVCKGPAAAYRRLKAECDLLGLPCQSHTNVKRLWAGMAQNISLAGERYGAEYVRTRMPYASFVPAEYRNEQWQADGKTIPFMVRAADGSGERWTVFIVMDNHSRRIVGYELGRTENTEVILAGLEKAVTNTGCWPGELVLDKHSYTRTESHGHLRREVERLGGNVYESINPQMKAYVERYNQWLDEAWREYPHYLGQGPKAKSRDANPKPELMNEAYKPANYKTPDEIRALTVAAIEQYNKTPMNALNGKTPDEVYAASESARAFEVSDDVRQRLFRKAMVYKVQRGHVVIKTGNRKHEFLLDSSVYDRYNGRYVEVRYEDLTQAIYVSDPDTGEFICEVRPKQRISSVYSRQTPEEKAVLHRITGRKKGAENKASRRQSDIIEQTQLQNPDVTDLLPALAVRKDIRAEILANPDLRRAVAVEGVNVDMIPERAETKPKVTERTDRHPFAQAPAAPRKLTFDDLLEMGGGE